MQIIKNSLSLLNLSFLLCLLGACSGGADGPDYYEVPPERVPSINLVLDGKGGAYAPTKTELEEKEKAEEKENSEEPSSAEPRLYSFTYEKLPDGGLTVEAYVKALLEEENPFFIIAENGARADAPDFSTESGNCTVRQDNSETQKTVKMKLSWEKDTLTVEAFAEDTAETANGDAPEPMNARESVDFLKSLPTSVLGLPGDSMQDYPVFYTDGSVSVDGVPYMRLRVYEIGQPEGTNSYLATYLLSGDRSKLYLLDPITKELTELTLP